MNFEDDREEIEYYDEPASEAVIGLRILMMQVLKLTLMFVIPKMTIIPKSEFIKMMIGMMMN